MAVADTSNSDTSLRRHLGLWDATALFVGIILGSGIFFAPSDVADVAPGLLSATALWAFGGFIAACGALCYAECGARLPHHGGFYIYYREVYGEPVAFVGGWAALLVTYPASLAAIALIFGAYLGEAIPVLADWEATCAAGAVGLAAVLNLAGLRTGTWTQRLLTALKVGAIAIVCGAALWVGGDMASHPAEPFATRGNFVAVVAALVSIYWTYSGWSDVTLVAGEIKEPAKNLGRTVFLGTAVLMLLYSLVQIAVNTLLPADVAAASKRVLSDAVGAGFGTGVGKLMAVLVVISTFGAVNGMVLATSRLGYAMARDAVIPRWFGEVHGRLGTPARAILGLLAVTLIYVASADFREILYLFTFSVWIFYALAAVSLVLLRRRRVGEPVAWHAPLGLLPPAVVVLTAIGMTVLILLDPEQRSLALAGLALLLAGFPVYFFWQWLRPRQR